MIFKNEDDSENDDEMKAHKKRQKLENQEKEKEKQSTRQIMMSKKKTNKGPLLLDRLLISKKGLQVNEQDQELSDSERELVQVRNEQIHQIYYRLNRMKHYNKIQIDLLNPVPKMMNKKEQKPKTIEEELFNKDEHIQSNNDIKRKWYIQNLNNLRKVEKRFRGIYLQLEFQDLDEFQKGEKYFAQDLWVGKSPDEVKRNNRNSGFQTNQNFSRTLSLNSDLNLHMTNPSFREVSTIGMSGIPRIVGGNQSTVNPRLMNQRIHLKNQKEEAQNTVIVTNKEKRNTQSQINQRKMKKNKDINIVEDLMKQDNENNDYFVLEQGEAVSKNSKSIYKKSNNDNHRHGLTTAMSINSNQTPITNMKHHNAHRMADINSEPTLFNSVQENENEFSRTRQMLQTQGGQRQTFQSNLSAYKFPQINDFQKTLPYGYLISQNPKKPMTSQGMKKSQSQKVVTAQVSETESNNEVKLHLRQQPNLKNQQEIEKLLNKLKSGQISHGSQAYQSSMFKFQNVYNLKKPVRRNIDKFIKKGADNNNNLIVDRTETL
ncbi:UNKNOWN [Stylonychia lemnae]|uniref:Uncharacterized protein n=1 Tax=Stylonychia lemnae TaxID=5949 RepID=A0A078AKA1_STYLE|nr:UNKNOWN [Stylonychia lemnae]|eukprot:CDW81233.1 UNKNOWN [Stylonychia lemnae]